MIEVDLAWPDSALSPNVRTHFLKKHEATINARETAFYTTIEKYGEDVKLGSKEIKLNISFYPPDKRHRDADNMLASIKAYLDGFAQALGVNDSQFNPIVIVRGQPIKGGSVKISAG